MDTIEKIELEEFIKNDEQVFENNRKIAVKNGWNFSKFKKFIGKFIEKQSEEGWICDYEAYCFMCSFNKNRIVHPSEFGEAHYDGKWNDKKNDVRKEKEVSICKCKYCSTTYDKKEVGRIYGKESSVYFMNFCSARCYTDYVSEKENL